MSNSARASLVLLLSPALLRTVPAQNVPPTLIGHGWGLDHVIIGLPNGDAATKTIGAKLGFTVLQGDKFPDEGIQQGMIQLPPGHIELLWPYQKPSTDQDLLHKIETGGGIAGYVIDVSPAEQAAAVLRRLGMSVTLPPSLKIRTRDGKETPGPWQFVLTSDEDQRKYEVGVPGGRGVGFIEHQNNEERLQPAWFQAFRERAETETPDPRRTSGEIHANTARKLSSIWIAVQDIASAVDQADRLGFPRRDSRELSILGARGREVQCGVGTIVFWEPMEKNGTLATIIKREGLGPFGVGVEVADLNRAHDIAEQGTGKKLTLNSVSGRKRFVVPGDLASGTWIEFVQR
jgi:hypothetical protein